MAGSKQLKITIVGDASGARSALRSLGAETDSFGSQMSRVGTVGLKAFAAIGAGVGAVVGFGVKMAAEAQTAQVGFETLLGSGEKARAFLGELQAFAARTPFEFPELRSAASRFLAVGVEASRVIPIMSAVGDATSAMGTGAVGIDRATTALTQMAQKGKVTAEEMMQLTEAGIPAWDALAAVLGTDVAGAMDAVSKRTVDAGSMFEALEKRAGPAMQRVAGMMDKQSQTLAGLFSTLKDTVGQSLATMAQPLVEGLTKAMPKITETLGGMMKTAGPALAGAFSSILQAAVQLLPAIMPLVSAFAGLFTHIGPIVGAIAGFLTKLAPLAPAIATTVGVMTGLGMAFRLLTAIMSVNPFVAIVTAVVFLTTLIIQNWDTIKSFLASTWESIKGIASSVWGAITGFLSGAWNAIKGAAETIFNALKTVFLNFTPVGLILNHWNTIKAFLIGVWNTLRSIASSVWEGIKTAIVTPFNVARAVVTSVADGIRNVVLGAFDAIRSGVSAVVSFFVDKFNWLKDRVMGIVNGIKSAIAKLPFVPGSPIPLVVDTQSAVSGVLQAFQSLRAKLPHVAAGIGARAPDLGSSVGAPALAVATPRGGTVMHVDVHVQVDGTVVSEGRLIDQIRDALLRRGRLDELWG